MALRARPSKQVDLSKIDDIQVQYFGETDNSTASTRENRANENSNVESAVIKRAKKNSAASKPRGGESSAVKPIKHQARGGDFEEVRQTDQPTAAVADKTELTAMLQALAKSEQPKVSTKDGEQPFANLASPIDEGAHEVANSGTIADLLLMRQFAGVRHTSRPFNIPRSLTIDLGRLKSKFRTRNLQYTQNELIDKMLKESLALVTAENYHELGAKAARFVKSPEQSSRRTVTLNEQTVHEINELKADLALTHKRRFSSDEIFSALLAIAFLPLYEQKLLP